MITFPHFHQNVAPISRVCFLPTCFLILHLIVREGNHYGTCLLVALNYFQLILLRNLSYYTNIKIRNALNLHRGISYLNLKKENKAAHGTESAFYTTGV